MHGILRSGLITGILAIAVLLLLLVFDIVPSEEFRETIQKTIAAVVILTGAAVAVSVLLPKKPDAGA